MDPNHGHPEQYEAADSQPYKGYAMSGKIMLSAIVILFFVVILMVCLHLYARWYLLRARRRHLRRNRHNRRTHIVFHDDNSAAATSAGSRGLDVSILNSLPVFVFDSKSKSKSTADDGIEEQPILECAVCLSEFEDHETGRLLPKCKHSFHIECIDMWFHSHSTCPLCRAPVEAGPGSESRPEVVINVPESVSGEPGPSSGLCPDCSDSHSGGGPRRTASFGGRVKPSDIVVPPRRNESFEDSGCGESPASQVFRSPMSRMLSFRRIISRERRNGGVSPSAGCSSVAESDIELGGRQETELTRRE